jgi:hypothetical protein
MKRSSTKTKREPSNASLREIPEVNLVRYRVVGRGRHVEDARRSFESVLIDPQTVKALGGPDGVRSLLDHLAGLIRPKRGKRRAA